MEELLKQILVEIRDTKDDIKEEIKNINFRLDKFEQEFSEFREEITKELNELRQEFYEFREEMYKFKEEITKELNELKQEFYEFKEEMNDFKKEVDKLFDKNTMEIAEEIRELATMISKKMYKLTKSQEINEKEHKIYEAQISRLQILQ